MVVKTFQKTMYANKEELLLNNGLPFWLGNLVVCYCQMLWEKREVSTWDIYV